MVLAISAPILIAYALVLSAVLAWLQRRGAAASGAGALVLCTFAIILQISTTPRTLVGSRGLQLAALLVLVPSAALWAVSRLSLFSSRPWLLMILGPPSFVLALVIATIPYNIFVNR
jgi:hypothetical protein